MTILKTNIQNDPLYQNRQKHTGLVYNNSKGKNQQTDLIK